MQPKTLTKKRLNLRDKKITKISKLEDYVLGDDDKIDNGEEHSASLNTESQVIIHLDGASISNAFAQNRALGLSTVQAHAAALDQHGVALFQGNAAGVFTKVPSLGLPGL